MMICTMKKYQAKLVGETPNTYEKKFNSLIKGMKCNKKSIIPHQWTVGHLVLVVMFSSEIFTWWNSSIFRWSKSLAGCLFSKFLSVVKFTRQKNNSAGQEFANVFSLFSVASLRQVVSSWIRDEGDCPQAQVLGQSL